MSIQSQALSLLDAQDDASITIHSPLDGEEVGTLPGTSREQIGLAVSLARAVQPEWAATSPADRGAALRRAAAALRSGAEELAALNTRETGKPAADSLGGIEAAISTLEQYAELGPVHRGLSLRGAVTATDYTVAEPRGVAVLLTPWNDPVAVAAGLIGAALVTGNTVIHKPSERCPHVGEMLGRLLQPAFPDGVLTTLTGGAEVGQLLTMETDVDVFAHVGSSATGERIARAASLTGAYVIRENGGNDPLVVDADVDPAWAAAQAALGAFANAGQICTSVERIYVHRDVAEPFLAALTEEAQAWTGSSGFPPLVDRRMRDAVEAQVGEALHLGARCLAGGTVPDGPGAHYPATVLTDCTGAMTIMTEETFGPVAPVTVVDSFDDGLRLAASGPYGLAATVLTGSIAHAQRAIAALAVGTVKINAVFGGAPGGSAQPRGISGAGFGYGPELLDEFSLVKVVHISSPPQGDA
ncbi:aldehyde dehydrogenase [Arthrobacter agilis]|uniref:aldehyde dehydrogenase family protein n=1 Tax=Arthrobacter agilis TaxID=37921 RepID=UPI000B35C952|nr:aldehyde dehydrogenase family protein [Arthrobacter agilis]OUM44205.1 aldehyde dehydrogenase [Arthrobacter agilis]PPB46579.1 aldehyde dehydrogenase [Arthrobacter agilis]TPV23763.1 aldehyde dehydrogenase [Arthrobacter agilis]VDR32493.1 Betaine aldehyde dehydrogenase [Arthrobacter agilis]